MTGGVAEEVLQAPRRRRRPRLGRLLIFWRVCVSKINANDLYQRITQKYLIGIVAVKVSVDVVAG